MPQRATRARKRTSRKSVRDRADDSLLLASELIIAGQMVVLVDRAEVVSQPHFVWDDRREDRNSILAFVQMFGGWTAGHVPEVAGLRITTKPELRYRERGLPSLPFYPTVQRIELYPATEDRFDCPIAGKVVPVIGGITTVEGGVSAMVLSQGVSGYDPNLLRLLESNLVLRRMTLPQAYMAISDTEPWHNLDVETACTFHLSVG